MKACLRTMRESPCWGAVGYPYPVRIRVGLETGVTVKRLFAKVTLDGVYSTTDPPDLTQEENQNILVANQDILKLIPTLTYSLSARVALLAEVSSRDPHMRN